MDKNDHFIRTFICTVMNFTDPFVMTLIDYFVTQMCCYKLCFKTMRVILTIELFFLFFFSYEASESVEEICLLSEGRNWVILSGGGAGILVLGWMI